MSGQRQGVHGAKPRSFACTKVKHFSRSSAQKHLEELKAKRVPGANSRLKVITCGRCTKKEKQDVFHVGHDNGKKGVRK